MAMSTHPWLQPTGWSLLLSDGQSIGVPACGLLIGRSSSCDLQLDDPDISRRHLLIAPMAGFPWAIDQGSSNGTTLDGMPLARKRLGERHELVLGSQLLEWELTEPIVPVLPPGLAEAWDDWNACLEKKRFPKDGLTILCRLAAAESARKGPHGGLALSWADPMGAESLGPLRRMLTETALRQVPA